MNHPPPLRPPFISTALLVLGALLAPAAFAQPAISLQAALELAYSANPELAAARQQVGAAQGARQQAGLLPNPELSLQAEDTRSDSRTSAVLLSQRLELGGKRGARINVADYGVQAARLELEQRGNQLRAEVVQAFFAAARAQVALDLAQQSRVLAEHGLKVAQGRIKAGKVSPIDATRAEVQVAETRLQVQRALTSRANAYRQLEQATASPLGVGAQVAPQALSPGAAPPTATLLGAIDQVSELRLAQVQTLQAEAALGSEKAQRIPDLTVSLGSQYSREDRERINLIGVSMPIPLFDRNQGNVLSAARRADQAQDLLAAARWRVRTQAQSALAQWDTASAETRAFEQTILPGAAQAVASATRGFEMGKFAFLDVLDAQRTLIGARSQYLDALATASDARVAVERIYGDLSRFTESP